MTGRAAWLAVVLLAGAVAGQTSLGLAPGMPTLRAHGVPLLYASIPNADRQALGLSLEPAEPYRWVVAPGEVFLATADCTGGQPGDTVVITAWDWHNQPVAQTLLPAGRETVLCEVDGQGVWLLTLDRFRGDQCIGRLARSFGVLPDNRAARDRWRVDEYALGTCAFPGRQHWTNDHGPAHPPGLDEQASRELEAELAARQGLQLVRTDVWVDWPGADAPFGTARLDASIAAWTDRGFKLMMQLGRPGDWAVLPHYQGVGDPLWRYPRAEEPSRRVVRELVERYGSHVWAYELYNEPDNLDFWRGTPEEYLALARWSTEEIRRLDQTTPIGSGSYTLLIPEWCGLFARELRPLVNWVHYHSHGDVLNLQHQHRAMLAIHAAAGYPPPALVNTEMGRAAWRLDQELLQATTSAQKAYYCWAHGHRGALLYSSREIGGPRQGVNWGFVDYTFCPRFAYGAINAMIELLAGASFERVLVADGSLHAYQFRRADETLVVVFDPSQQSRRLTVRSTATGATIFDGMGNPLPVDNPHEAMLSYGGYPVTVRLTGATGIELVR